jgi:hypothetical protein
VNEPDVYQAVKDYLEKAGRISVPKSGGTLWTRNERASKPGTALDSRTFANNLKENTKAAGVESVHPMYIRIS